MYKLFPDNTSSFKGRSILLLPCAISLYFTL